MRCFLVGLRQFTKVYCLATFYSLRKGAQKCCHTRVTDEAGKAPCLLCACGEERGKLVGRGLSGAAPFLTVLVLRRGLSGAATPVIVLVLRGCGPAGPQWSCVSFPRTGAAGLRKEVIYSVSVYSDVWKWSVVVDDLS